MSKQNDILFTEVGQLGVVTLNRPQALNALSHEMAIALNEQLIEWEDDEEINAILIQAEGEKAFCAGGDIRKIYEAKSDPKLTIKQFFWDEYRLNSYIHHYKKPYIAFLDGITMGGGVGISIHGSCRIATEKFSFAMPETGIGFFPDIGGSYLLSHCPGETGVYLGLTGARIKVADALYLGLVNHFVPSDNKTELFNALTSTSFTNVPKDALTDILKDYATTPEPAPLSLIRSLIDECFAFDHIEEIIDALQKHNDEWCINTAKILLSKSPTSLKVTLEQLRKAKNKGFNQCMQMEYRLTNRFLKGHDFYEGVRAVIVDKDQKPQWKPANLSDVTQKDVEQYFAPLTATEELNFDL